MVGYVMKINTSTKETNTEVIVAKKKTTTDYIAARQKRRPWWNCELSITSGLAQIAVKNRVAAISTFAMLTAKD